GAELVTRGLVLVTGVVLARALSAPEFGDFSYAFGVAVVAGFLVDLGLASLVIRDVSADPDRAPALLAAFLQAQGLLAVGTFALVTAANVLYTRIDILMLGHLDTDTSVGNYGVASRVLDAAVVLPAFFGNAFLATISATGPDTERGRMQTTEALRWIVLM